MADKTKGTLLKIGDGATPEVFLTVGKVFSVGEVKGTRDTEDVTTHDSPDDAREFISKLIDYGAIAIQYRYKLAEAGQDALSDAFDDGELHNFQIVFPTAVGAQWTFAAIVTEYGTGDSPVDGVLNGMASLKISGKPTLEASA